MGRFVLLAAVAVFAAAVAATPAGADTAITVGDGWHEFDWTGQTQPVIPTQSPFTFTATTKVTITVVDVLCTGEAFTLYDNGVLIGSSSTPKVTPSCPGTTDDPNVAINDKSYSSGSADLGPGQHSIAIVVSTAPWPNGGAYFRVDEKQCRPSPGIVCPMAKKFH